MSSTSISNSTITSNSTSKNGSCNDLRNPFIKNPSNEIYSISNKVIETIRNEHGDKNEKLKIFKRNILPKIMTFYKNEFVKFNSSNSYAMELLLVSNHFKQFVDLYFNRDYFPQLDGINQLIENKNRVIEGDEDNAIDGLYKDIENSENIYYQKNKVYKENILKFISSLSKKYFVEFRGYADFETTKSIIELNTLTNYLNFLKTVPSLLTTKSENDIKKEINKNFNLIINIFPSSVYELLPREIIDFMDDNKLKPILSEQNISQAKNFNNKFENLIRKINELKENITYYSKTFINEIETQEKNYKTIIEIYNQIIKIEQKEEVLFHDLQSIRNQLNAKIKEIGKGIQDKKYSLLVNEFDKAYNDYNTIVCEKLNLYKYLETLIDTNSPNKPNIRNNKISLKVFNLKIIFTKIFENIINCEKNKDNSDILRKNIFNYLYRETNKGKNDIELESIRNEDKRNIYEFTLSMNDIFEENINFLKNKIETYTELKEKVLREINILKNMEESAKAQLTNKKSYMDDLDREKQKIDGELTKIRETVSRKKSDIQRELDSAKITAFFGRISSFNNALKSDSNIAKNIASINKLPVDGESRYTEYKSASTALASVRTLIESYKEDIAKQSELERKLSNIISELREIREGPEEYTKQVNAKNTFSKRIDEQLNELKSILDKKEKSNKELQDLIGNEAFKTVMNELYGALITRYKSIASLIKKKNIRSEVYNIFSNDILYKTIKTLEDLINMDKEEPIKIRPESIIEIVKSFETYVNKRLEDFPRPEIETNEGEMKFKRYQLQTMSNVLKGQQIGKYYVKPNANMKSFVKKIKNQNVNDISFLLKKLYNKELSMNQIEPEKLSYYLKTYGNMQKNVVVSGGNKKNIIINVKENEFFMKSIYNILLEDNTKNSKDFVDRLKNFEYKLLNIAKSKLKQFLKQYKSNSVGSDKIKDHIIYIYKMAKASLDEFDNRLTNIIKKGKASNELINILIISQYIYMEVIMIYALAYFS